ncbi:MAG: glycoside hydrolase family 92 protein [Bacteroidales bacterium]|nr:glycoside hydrolase family 92 protein [Bacteroidales bacterium]
MKRTCFQIISILFLLGTWNHLIAQDNQTKKRTESVSQYVNPLIGTKDMGHCYPGATAPFGMVQLSPDTDTAQYTYGQGYNKEVYRYCSGYQYDDPTIVGFSHTHLHGTGHSDLGDILIMPTTGEIRLNPGIVSKPNSGYRSRYSKSTEKTSAGYYSVFLEDYKIKAELTATARVGHHRYVYPKDKDANVILDLVHGIYGYDGKVIWASIRVENDSIITGYRQTNGWARNRFIYFAIKFSKPFKSFGLRNDEKEVYRGFWRRWQMDNNFPERSGHKVKAYFTFGSIDTLEVKVAISGVSTIGAMENLRAEVASNNFDKTLSKVKNLWEQELSRIRVDGTNDEKVNFYTALYHCMLCPTIFMDVDGKYKGLDGNIHQANGFTNYTVFSLWDTFRAFHPLMTLLEPTRAGDMVNSMLEHYKQSVHGILPVWSHWGNDNWCMIGYHAVPVIADAYMKGIKGFDSELALKAMVSSATYLKYDGIDDYTKYGYLPKERSSSSASVTLEYAYDDWTIYQMANKMGKIDIVSTFKKRAMSYANIFDTKTGFARAKDKDGKFITPFDPLQTHDMGFIEGNAWNYSLFVPHDISNLINLSGGKARFTQHLDSLFTMTLPPKYYENTEDIDKVGIMGNYVHGNEPSHHVAYMFVYAGQPWKTQEIVRNVINRMYLNKPDGLCGNDDCGQMSAWYIFSAMGFYPVCPGSNQYIIGAPYLPYLSVTLENGKVLTIKADGVNNENRYIQSATLNGKPLLNAWITHTDLIDGGELVFKMGKKPNKKWGVEGKLSPYSMSKDV